MSGFLSCSLFLTSIPLRAGGYSTPGVAKKGIFCGTKVGTGNLVSHSHRRTKRKWKPNVHTKSLYSTLLDKDVKVKLTTHALRCIDRKGGLDNFLLYSKVKRLEDSEFGLNLRTTLIEAYKQKYGLEKFRPSDERFLKRFQFSLPRYPEGKTNKRKVKKSDKTVDAADTTVEQQ